MTWETPSTPAPSSCLVQVREEPEGQYTAQVVGASDLRATAATREEALEQHRALLQEQVNLGSLLSMEVSRQNPLMRWFGYAKDDPYFEECLEESQKFREEMDRREGQDWDSGECPDTSLTQTT
jgi:hypothetical protein